MSTKIEIEKRALLLTHDKSFVSKAWGPELYHKVLQLGDEIHQGYITNKLYQEKVITKLFTWGYTSISPIKFNPSVFRLRQRDTTRGLEYWITLKDDIKPQQSEWERPLSLAEFEMLWGFTSGKRIHKKRYELLHPSIPFKLEIDGFLDRYMLIAEVEVPTLKDYNLVKLPGKDISKLNKYSNKNLAK